MLEVFSVHEGCQDLVSSVNLPSRAAHFLLQCFIEKMKPEWRMNMGN